MVLYKHRVVPGLMNRIDEKHSICLYNTMVPFHQSHTWEQGPLYLSMQHHGFFSPIPCMRTETTLSVYTTSWSLLYNWWEETMMLYRQIEWSLVSHVWDWWEETMVLHRQIEWSLVSCMGSIPYMRPVTIICVYATSWSLLTNPMHENRNHYICLYNIRVSSHQSHTWEQACMVWDWWEEIMMLHRQIEWSLFSCMGLVRRDHDVV
jgi:hypothetical protein